MENFTEQKNTLGLYDPQFEHDACGIGAVVDIKGRKSHQTVDDALAIVERLEHRAGKDAEGKTGDGVGILLQISHKFFSKVAEELNISLGNEREYGVGMFFFPQSEHLRAQAMNKNCLKACNCQDLIRIIKTIYLRKRAREEAGRKETAVDARYFRIAEDQLYGELAVALDMSRENVESYINTSLQSV